MEPVKSNTNPHVNSAVTQASAAHSASDANKAAPMPVKVEFTATNNSILLNDVRYSLNIESAQQAQTLKTANSYAISLANGLQNVIQGQKTQLLALAQAITIKLPEPLIEIARQNGVNATQLLALAARPQGYPLPQATVSNGELQLTPNLRFTPTTQLPLIPGDYLPKIALQNQQLVLVLTHVLAKADISLSALSTATPMITAGSESVIQQKLDSAQIYSALVKKLETTLVQNTTNKALDPASTSKITTPESNNATSLSEGGKTINASNAKLDVTASNISTDKSANSQKNPSANVTVPNPANFNLTDAAKKDVTAQNSKNIAPSDPQATQPSDKPSLGREITPLSTVPLKSGELIAQKAISAALTQQNSQTLSTSGSINNTLGTEPKSVADESKLVNAINEVKSKSTFNNIIERALSKAGTVALPSTASPNNQQNLASLLLKLLPDLSPFPLGELIDPHALEDEVVGLSGLNLASSQQALTNSSLNANAMTTLFQLLLGFRLSSQGKLTGNQLQQYLQQLQGKTGFNAAHLSQLDKAGTLEAVAQMAAGLSLYQQASADGLTSLNWFFALPYSIGQRHEQLEGQFEQDKTEESDTKLKAWRLQLKFNLASGPLLIKAIHQHGQLDLQFKANDAPLLNRVSNYFTPLSQKLTQIGFTPGELSTHVEPIPATLLPGDHYLVKLKV